MKKPSTRTAQHPAAKEKSKAVPVAMISSAGIAQLAAAGLTPDLLDLYESEGLEAALKWLRSLDIECYSMEEFEPRCSKHRQRPVLRSI